METKTKKIFGLLSVPLILISVYFSMFIVWKIFGLPPIEELTEILKGYFDQYGLWVVLLGSIVEGALLLGQYFPGGTIIFLGVVSSIGDIPSAIRVILVVDLGFFLAYTFNYMLGKYGWYKLLVKFGFKQSLENAKEKLSKQGLNAVILSYWEPNLASITATSAGILRIPLKTFSLYSLIGIILWNTVWGVLVYSLGEAALQMMGVKYVLVIFFGWVGLILFKNLVYDKRKERKKESIE